MEQIPDLHTISTPALAYLGDSVLELCVRGYLVSVGYSSSARLNEASLAFVRASAQAQAMEKLQPYLTEEELAIFKRGRNIGHTNVPKHATISEYRAATGMETLFGWLYLSGQQTRINELFRLAYLND